LLHGVLLLLLVGGLRLHFLLRQLVVLALLLP
jgi:hypothetical protein